MRQHNILIVDDEGNILSALKRLLRSEPYNIITTQEPKEAKALMSETPTSLIISDQRMPEVTGIELLTEVKKLYPDTMRILLSGYADFDIAIKAINEGGVFRFISKPWSDEDLKIAIKQALEHYDLLMDNKTLLKMVEKQRGILEEIKVKYPDALELPQIKDGAYVIESPQESLEDFMKRYFPKGE